MEAPAVPETVALIGLRYAPTGHECIHRLRRGNRATRRTEAAHRGEIAHGLLVGAYRNRSALVLTRWPDLRFLRTVWLKSIQSVLN